MSGDNTSEKKLSVSPVEGVCETASGETASFRQEYAQAELSLSKDLDLSTVSLNEPQLEAVCHVDGPLLVFAGAGSGKTRVLTYRFANLVQNHGVHPERIFTVTFTNKAAGEMKERIHRLLGTRVSASWISTFHSACVRILRRHAKYMGFGSNFAIYNADDSLSLIRRIMKREKIDPKKIDAKLVRSQIDKAKNAYRDSQWFREHRSRSEFEAGSSLVDCGLIADIYDSYQAELLQANAMDFADLLFNVVTLFKLEKDILSYYREHFLYVMVDEYQDTNTVQYLLIRALSDGNKNICVVGDDDQSIYAFRGATIDNILNFKKDFPDAKTVTLDINYRSSSRILEAANALIEKNNNRQPKKMRTNNPQGAAIVGYKGYDEIEEAEFIAQEVSAYINRGGCAGDIAIFYRTNAQSRAIEEAFLENSIAYDIYGGFRFYERKEIKDIMAYFRLLLNESDNQAFLRVVNTPTRGIGANSVGHLQNDSAKKGEAFYASLKSALSDENSFLKGASKKKFQNFVFIIEELKTELSLLQSKLEASSAEVSDFEKCHAFSEFIISIAKKSTYLERLKAEDTPESESRYENILELAEVAAEYINKSLIEEQEPALIGFIERATLSSDLDKENRLSGFAEAQSKEEKAELKSAQSKRISAIEERKSVSLMTLHLAKGLEFKIVFLVGLEDGVLPHSRSIDSVQDLEEERRLCYVGITRAKDKLFLSRALVRHHYRHNNYYSGLPSRFLRDLPRDVVEDRQGGFFYDDY